MRRVPAVVTSFILAPLILAAACAGADVAEPQAVSTSALDRSSTDVDRPLDPSGPSLEPTPGAPPTDESRTAPGAASIDSGDPDTDHAGAEGPAGALGAGLASDGRGRLVIHAAGDVSLDPAYIPAFSSEGYEHAFSGLDGLFAEDSLTVVNLECPASTRGTALDKEFTFRCDPEALLDARAAGVDVVNLANNHILDYGPDAARDTLDHLATAGIAGVGVGEDSDAAARPAFFEVDGWTIAVVGFGGVVPSPGWLAAEDRFGMADGDDTESMAATVASAARHADLVIVTVHWGVELDTEPRADDVARAEAMIAAGADMIFGHHSHRLNPLTTLDGTPVAWGLGNFVWPSLSAEGSTTAIARVIVEPDGTLLACLLPATIESHGHPVPDGPLPDGCPQA